jgi:hypothetical protein
MKTTSYTKLLMVLLFTIPHFANSQVTILSENFSEETLPPGWTNTDLQGSGDKWAFNDPGNRNISAGNFSGGFAIVDSDEYGFSSSQKALLTTSSFNTTPYETVNLDFDFQYREYDGPESCAIQVYNGSTWTSVLTYVLGDENFNGASHVSIDITEFTANASSAQVRFYFIGKYDWWFALDNIEITGEEPPLVSSPTGPGGIGSGDGSSSLRFWIDANEVNYSNNDKVSSVNNLSGYGNPFEASGTERPTYQLANSSINNLSSFTFNGNNQLKSNYNGNSNENMSFIAIYKATVTTDLDIIIQHGGRNTMGIEQANKHSDYVGGSNHTSTTTNTGSWMIRENSLSSSGTSELKYYINNTNTDNFSHNIESRTSPTWVGGNGTGGGTKFNGSIAEALKFTKVLNEAERIIIHNYLSAKYDIALNQNDYYTQDNPGSGNFDFNVAGIGRATDGSLHNNSQGTGIIKINTPSDLNRDEYLFWGENINNSTYEFTTNTTDYLERQNSTWRVSKRNDLGTVSVSVAASDLDLSGKQACAPLRIIVSNTSTFSSKTTYELSLSEGIYTANNVAFNDGDYFTFDYQDVIAVDNSTFYNGSGGSNKPNTSDACYKLLVKSTATGILKLSENANVREVEIETGGLITLNTNTSLIVTGNINNEGIFTLEENASLIQNTTGANSNSGSGSYAVTRKGNNSAFVYNIWSSPIQNANITSVFTDANPCDVWVFDRLSQAWSHDFSIGYSTTCYGNPVTFTASDVISGGDGIMDVTGGYFVPGSATSSKTYTGDVNNGDYSKAISITSLGNPGGSDWGDDDWNLLGNPYPSALSAGAFWTENAINNNRITDALYFWDEADTTGGYNQNSDYASWNLSGGVNSGNSLEIPSGNIASGQGFWVVANANTDVVFNNTMRASSNSQFFKQQNQNIQHNAWFSFTSPSGYQNNILVGYNSATTDQEDPGYDAHKLVGNAHVRFASFIDADEFVIQSIAPLALGSNKTIPLVVTSDEAGMHTFSGYKRENIPANLKIYLRDNRLNIDTDMASNDYTIQLDANVEYTARFELVFKNTITSAGTGNSTKGGTGGADTSTVTGIDENTNSNFTLIQNENEIVISNKDGMNGAIKIFDVTGKLIWKKENIQNQVSQTINLNSISSGTYFITIIHDGKMVLTKQWVRP